MVMRPFWAEIKKLRTCYCAPYKFVSFGLTNTIVSDLDIGLSEYVKIGTVRVGDSTVIQDVIQDVIQMAESTLESWER